MVTKAVVAAVCGLVVAGCAANRQEVKAVLGQQYIGQSVNQLIGRFGPPGNAFRMNNGDQALSWQLTNQTDIVGDNYGASGRTAYCKVNVVSNAAGTIVALDTEDVSGTGGIVGAMGVDVRGSLCARHLGIASPAR